MEVTFAPFDCPPDAVISDLTQRGSPSTPHTLRDSVTFIAKSTDKNIKPNASAKAKIRSLPTNVHQGFNIQFDNGSPKVAYLFRKMTYLAKTTIGGLSNTSLAVARFLDSGCSRDLINKDF